MSHPVYKFLIHINNGYHLSVQMTQVTTSGLSREGPTCNRVSSMLVVSYPLPAMDILPGKA